MPTEALLLVITGAFAAGFINGLAGFGTSLFALVWWLEAMPPAQAVAAILVVSVVSSVQGVIHIRRAIEWPLLSRFLFPAFLGIPFGLQILEHIEPGLLKMVIGCFMLLYGGFFIFRRDLPSVAHPYKAVDVAIGFISGILGAVAGLSGALPTMWISLRDWTKEKSRAILQPFNMVVLATAAALLALDGAYDWDTLLVIAISLPVSLSAAQIGLWAFKRLSDQKYRRLLIVIMCVFGIGILASELGSGLFD